MCTLLTRILSVPPLVPSVHRSRDALLLSEHSSDVEWIYDELYITRQPSCEMYPTTQPKCLASISLAPCDITERHPSYSSSKGVFKNVSVLLGCSNGLISETLLLLLLFPHISPISRTRGHRRRLPFPYHRYIQKNK